MSTSATKPSGKAIANETRAASSPSDAWLSDMFKRSAILVRHDKVKTIKSCSLPLFKLMRVLNQKIKYKLLFTITYTVLYLI